MKIVYLVPGRMPQDEAQRRVGLMRKWAAPGTQVDIMVVQEGPASIESTYEELMEQKGYFYSLYNVSAG